MLRKRRATSLTPPSPFKNSELFSTHWLTHRLQSEPEWQELRAGADSALSSIAKLWKAQATRVQHYGSEQALEAAFIQPVLKILGWELIYQPHLRGRRPDYALFQSEESLQLAVDAGRTNPDFWKYPVAVADSKDWNISLDRPTIVNQQREYPPEQIEWYLDRSQLNYALLTNGKTWRLIPREHPGQPRFQTYFQCDLVALLEERLSRQPTLLQVDDSVDDFLRFFLFFSPSALVSQYKRVPLVERARAGSTEYRIGVGDSLRNRVFQALELCIEGFLSHKDNQLIPKTHIELCREQSLILLYRLLFILYAEDRGLLPYKINHTYTENRSLGRLRDLVAKRLDRIGERRDPDFSKTKSELWTDLQSLFEGIDTGLGRYGIPAYNGGLFDPNVHPFLRQKVLPDFYLARVIDHLGRAPDPSHPQAGLSRVDYRDLAIQHLGNIYEGLLERKPLIAEQVMIEVRATRGDHRVNLIAENAPPEKGMETTGRRIPKGSVYLEVDRSERRSTGSYYTPNDIVDFIVEKTIGPLCDEFDVHLRKESETTQEHSHSAHATEPHGINQRSHSLEVSYDDLIRSSLIPVIKSLVFTPLLVIRPMKYWQKRKQDKICDISRNSSAKLKSTRRRSKERIIFISCLFVVPFHSYRRTEDWALLLPWPYSEMNKRLGYGT